MKLSTFKKFLADSKIPALSTKPQIDKMIETNAYTDPESRLNPLNVYLGKDKRDKTKDAFIDFYEVYSKHDCEKYEPIRQEEFKKTVKTHKSPVDLVIFFNFNFT